MSEPAYHRPEGVREALALLRDLGPDARVLAGGQDLVPLMNQNRLHPAALVDISRLASLREVTARNGALVIGALAVHRDIERSETIRVRCGFLAEAAAQIGGGIQVRNRGTIGGAACAAEPAYDYAACLVALDAQFRAAGTSGERRIPASAFFAGVRRTALRPDELLLDVTVPAFAARTGFAYRKLRFTEGGNGVANAACVVGLRDDGMIEFARLVIGGAAAVPVRVVEAESRLAGRRASAALLADVGALARQAVVDPISDVMADGEYRRAMAGVMAQRALARAIARARGTPAGGAPLEGPVS